MGLFDAIASGFGSIFSGVTSSINNAANRRFQREMWNDQKAYNTSERIASQEYNTQERLQTQAYNSPANQLSRLMAAGINPNSALSMMGDGSSSPMSVSGASASPSFTDQPNPFGDLGSLAMNVAQVQKMKADAEGQEIQNRHMDELLSLNGKQLDQAIKTAKATEDYTIALKGKTEAETKSCNELLDLALRKGDKEIEQMTSFIDKLAEEIKLIQQQQKNAEKEGNVLDAQEGLIKGQTAVQGQVARLTHEQMLNEAWLRTSREQGYDPQGDWKTNLTRLFMADDPTKAKEAVKNIFAAAKEGLKGVWQGASNFATGTQLKFPSNASEARTMMQFLPLLMMMQFNPSGN